MNNNLDMPTGPEESQTVEAHANGEQDLAMEPAPKSKKSKKPKRARIVDPEQHSKEEESARTLLEMKGAHDLERTYSNEDDRAASSQILSETLVQASPDLPDNLSNGPALETLKPRKARKEKKSKRSEKRKAVEADAAELALMLVEDEPDITHDGLIPSTHAYPDPHVHDYQYQPAASIDSGFGLQHAPVASLSANGCYISTDGHAGSNYNTAGELLGYGPHNAKFAAVRSPVRTYASRPENARRRFKPSNSYMASSPPVTAASLAVAANAANALIDPALTTQDDDIWAVPDSQANGTLGDRSEDFIGTSSSTKQPAKRKRRLPDVSGSQTDSTQPTKRTKLSNDKKSTPKETAQGNASAGKNSSKLGPFDDSEITLLTDFMEEYREYHDLSEHQLNEKVQMTGRGTGPRDGFWDEVCDVLPYRTRQSIMKVCRRRFHNYGKRGKWTADDDEMLEQAQKEKPNKWKEIGEMIGRLPEDCRDRWRNYLTCGDKRKTDVWTEQEVAMLKKAVAECMDNMRKAKAQEAKGNPIKEGYASFKVKDGKSDVDLINWSVVSDMMGNCRSRLQCLYKWKKLKQNEEQELEKKKKEAEEKEEPSDLDTNQPAKAAKVSWRIRRAQQNYDKMLPGDKMEILRA